MFSGSIRNHFVRPEATDEFLGLEQASVCLLGRADRGLDTVIGEEASGFGWREAAPVDRPALLRKPQLLVFDEATSADSLTEEESAGRYAMSPPAAMRLPA
jgi:ATP-binding cassette subfamily B protein